mmetsp:Transcript_3119/g.14061  ORF Transcript_3119/g.14061 Transcript_3119/m.14061 type:complete len:320 (-) Transcript_3119:1075-2034(-)
MRPDHHRGAAHVARGGGYRQHGHRRHHVHALVHVRRQRQDPGVPRGSPQGLDGHRPLRFPRRARVQHRLHDLPQVLRRLHGVGHRHLLQRDPHRADVVLRPKGWPHRSRRGGHLQQRLVDQRHPRRQHHLLVRRRGFRKRRDIRVRHLPHGGDHRHRAPLHPAHDPPPDDRHRGPQGCVAGHRRHAHDPLLAAHSLCAQRNLLRLGVPRRGVPVRLWRAQEGRCRYRDHLVGRDPPVHVPVPPLRHLLDHAVHRRPRRHVHRRRHRGVLLATRVHAQVPDPPLDPPRGAVPRRFHRARFVHRRGGSVHPRGARVHRPQD